MEHKWTVDAAITRPFTHLCKARAGESIAIRRFLKISHDVRLQTRPGTSAHKFATELLMTRFDLTWSDKPAVCSYSIHAFDANDPVAVSLTNDVPGSSLEVHYESTDLV